MALGGRIGVGAIAGVATAVCFGGPGAIFWMWVYAIFLALAVLFFAFTTILSFGFYVMPNISYPVKNNKYLKQITIDVGCLQMVSIILGSVRESAFAWNPTGRTGVHHIFGSST